MWPARSGTILDSAGTAAAAADEMAAAFSYETMNSFRFRSPVRLEQTSTTADTSDSYSVSAACKQHSLVAFYTMSPKKSDTVFKYVNQY